MKFNVQITQQKGIIVIRNVGTAKIMCRNSLFSTANPLFFRISAMLTTVEIAAVANQKTTLMLILAVGRGKTSTVYGQREQHNFMFVYNHFCSTLRKSSLKVQTNAKPIDTHTHIRS